VRKILTLTIVRVAVVGIFLGPKAQRVGFHGAAADKDQSQWLVVAIRPNAVSHLDSDQSDFLGSFSVGREAWLDPLTCSFSENDS